LEPAATAKEVWRFSAIPRPGEPGSKTWQGRSAQHGSGATWMTATYDPQLDLVYGLGRNPAPDFNGDNLYSDSVLAEAKTGKLKWYYQFTPTVFMTGMRRSRRFWSIPTVTDSPQAADPSQ
jgi:alcohol dehydrogenase (cytochrome c)